MSVLGLEKEGPTEVSVGFRRGWLSHVKIALASAGWVAVIAAVIGLMERQPREGFGLLLQWGPWPLVALVAIAFFGRFLSRLNDTVQVSFSSMVESARDGAKAQGRTADALTQLADQGGRQAEEVRRLAIYAGREFPVIYERFDRQDFILKTLSDSFGQMHELLAAMKKRDEALEE